MIGHLMTPMVSDKVIEIGSDSFDKSLRSLAVEGQISFVGTVGAGEPQMSLNALFRSMGSIRVVATGNRAHFLAMNKAITANSLRPVIDRVFSFADVPEAYKYFDSGNYFGKVIVSQDI